MDTVKKSNNQQSLLTQLSELNARSRWYSAQLWHIPFAYLGLTAVILVGLARIWPDKTSIGFLLAGLFGICVIVHIIGLMIGETRAVTKLKEVEDKLDLDRTVKHMPWLYLPLQIAVLATVVIYLRLYLRGIPSITTGSFKFSITLGDCGAIFIIVGTAFLAFSVRAKSQYANDVVSEKKLKRKKLIAPTEVYIVRPFLWLGLLLIAIGTLIGS